MKKLVRGVNDLETVYPLLAVEFDSIKNGKTARDIRFNYSKRMWWTCPNRHDSYLDTIHNRLHGTGCRICNKVLQKSFPEQAVFFYIKKFFPDAVSKYKELFKNAMELDIFIPSKKVGIEYDGYAWHNSEDSKNRENKKYTICKDNGIFLYRIREQLLDKDNADKVFNIPKFSYDKPEPLNDVIRKIVKELTHSAREPVIEIEKDIFEILKYRIIKYEDSVAYLYPKLVKEWHPTLNNGLKPENVLPGMTVKVWWRCSKGHEWKSSIVNRTKGHGCDVCATKQRKDTYHKTRLRTRKLLIDCKCIEDWDYSKNTYGPEYYTKSSGESVWWKCHKCGHEWEAVICDRTRDYRNGCPSCSRKTLVRGRNDLLTTNRELVEKEWNYELNGNLKPSDVTQWSHNPVWWTCSKCGYSYEATPSNRVYGKGCGCCAGRVVVPGINDLTTTRPDIAIDWHPTKNGHLKPSQVTKGKRDMIWWKCHICGNEWQDSLSHRSNGRGCAVCKRNSKKK